MVRNCTAIQPQAGGITSVHGRGWEKVTWLEVRQSFLSIVLLRRTMTVPFELASPPLTEQPLPLTGRYLRLAGSRELDLFAAMLSRRGPRCCECR